MQMQWLNVKLSNSSWKIYRNTPSFVPKPGDIVCWTYGWAGHTGIVVGPSDKKTFRTVDQNWFGANQYSGSRAAYVKHTYSGMGGNIYFIRPPYKASNNSAPAKKQDTNKVVTKKKNVQKLVSLLMITKLYTLNSFLIKLF